MIPLNLALGAGAMMVASRHPMIWRVRSAAALAGGATTVEFNRGIERSSSRITSGGGATIAFSRAKASASQPSTLRREVDRDCEIHLASRFATGASEEMGSDVGRVDDLLGARVTARHFDWPDFRGGPAGHLPSRASGPSAAVIFHLWQFVALVVNDFVFWAGDQARNITACRASCRAARWQGPAKMASAPQETSSPRRGNRPVRASPARAASERVNAGPSEVQNSSQREDHSTSNLGPSIMRSGVLRRFPDRFQADHQL